MSHDGPVPTCPLCGAETFERKDFCAEHWKQVTPDERRRVIESNGRSKRSKVIRQIVKRLKRAK